MPSGKVDKRPVCMEVYEKLISRDVIGKMVFPDHVLRKFAQKIRVAESGCWEWLGGKYPRGYGCFEYYKCSDGRAHRVSWRLFKADKINGLILHRCDNPPCCNPDHLFEGNNQDNSSDMKSKNRNRRGEMHGMAKLNQTDVLRIRELISEGLTLRKIGEKFNLPAETIFKIKHRLSWRWL